MTGPFDDARFKRDLLSGWMFEFRRPPALPVVTGLTGDHPGAALRELRDADPNGYALLTEHLDLPKEWLPDA